ncbi:hypothetical protein DH2020_021455 [Rehmannia glutinosa]|uniref:Alkaline/neutral invertase n=1 Tax=Rehmannia glutinosa TaxID=99300 RepID=A0ABR0WBX9_REHGL
MYCSSGLHRINGYCCNSSTSLRRSVSCLYSSKTHFSTGSFSRSIIRYKKRRDYNKSCCNGNIYHFHCVNVASNRLELFKCNCQRSENVSGLTSEDGNGAWYVDNAKDYPTINGNKANVLESEKIKESSSEREAFSSNGSVRRNGAIQDTLQKDIANSVEDEAWELLKESMVYYCGSPVGTIAAKDPTSSNVLNYDQVFIRDFVPSGIAFLLKGIMISFSWEKTMDCHSPGQGLMPASFKVRTVPLDGDDFATEEVLDPDFGEAAIGRVAPVDSGLWWIILLRAYGKCSGDLSVQERIDVQTGIKMILRLCLADGFDMHYFILHYYAHAKCSLREGGSADLIRALNSRLVALSFHIREYYWIDMRKLNEIYRYKTEEYSYDAVNKFNIYPDQIPPWLVEWMPSKGGYLIGNLQPAHMDFRFFSLGNLWSVVSSLSMVEQSHAILDLIEAKWLDLVADMPFKICYPALEGKEWQIITGCDPKNTPWSYHNGGSWPTLLWQLTVACIKMNRPEIAEKAIKIAEKRISKDKWPEYYDTKKARFIGKQAQLYQTWSIAGYLVAKLLLANPNAAKILITEEDSELINAFSCAITANPRRKRGPKSLQKTYIV